MGNVNYGILEEKKKVQCFYKESFITFSLLYESKMNLMKFTTCLSDVLFQTRTTE